MIVGNDVWLNSVSESAPAPLSINEEKRRRFVLG